ncbi:30S ribosomal protein S21 [Mangrovimonas aestuarii]|uniref:30S ribosomal protein S21 n=1 Tax=Mangrovimonas aestuarii TaxID=3018443 RepID=UPI0023782F51|nr:30S ribosomal protein S21 [Mangrovimonas aestuarii]
MLIVEVKEGEKIERALKRFKRKYRDTKVLQNLRDKQHFTKKSVRRRKEIQKAQYIQALKNQEEI